MVHRWEISVCLRLILYAYLNFGLGISSLSWPVSVIFPFPNPVLQRSTNAEENQISLFKMRHLRFPLLRNITVLRLEVAGWLHPWTTPGRMLTIHPFTLLNINILVNYTTALAHIHSLSTAKSLAAFPSIAIWRRIWVIPMLLLPPMDGIPHNPLLHHQFRKQRLLCLWIKGTQCHHSLQPLSQIMAEG